MRGRNAAGVRGRGEGRCQPGVQSLQVCTGRKAVLERVDAVKANLRVCLAGIDADTDFRVQ